MKFITPHYEEAISRLKERLDRVDVTPENYRETNRLAQLNGDSFSISILDPRIQDTEFQRTFEQRLRQAGVVRHVHVDKSNNTVT